MEILNKEINELGFEILRELNEREKRYISNFISNKLTDKYPYLNIGYFDMFSILYNTQMYFSKMPENISNVNYLTQDMSIHFSEDKDIYDLDEIIFSAGIHKIQDKRDKSGNFMNLGLCRIVDSEVKGLGFNKAAVQYIVSSVLEKHKKDIKIYNISVKTISDNQYSLITNIIEQIVLLMGEEKLVHSTILADNHFSQQLINYFGEENFKIILENLDEIVKLSKEINNEKKEENIDKISEIYFKTQKLIYTIYFDKSIFNINRLDEINFVRQQLYEYAKLIFSSEKFDEFKSFYNEKVIELKELEININAKYALALTNKNIFYKFFLKIKKLFYKKVKEENVK